MEEMINYVIYLIGKKMSTLSFTATHTWCARVKELSELSIQFTYVQDNNEVIHAEQLLTHELW